MIIIKYIVRETLKSQLAILLILLMIFFCQKLVKFFETATNIGIPINLVISILWLGIPEIAQLVLPLSLFLSLLMIFGKFHSENEIIIMHACGLSETVLLKAAIILAFFTGIFATVNVMWAVPLSSRRQNGILAEAKVNPNRAILVQGQFQQIPNSSAVLFIENINGDSLNDIFLAQLHSKGKVHPSIIVANSGQLSQYKNGSQVINLNRGTLFEGTAMTSNFRITDFKNYQAVIGHQIATVDLSDVEQMNIRTLINTNTSNAIAELHWRITLVFSVFVMALIVVPCSIVNQRQDRAISVIIAMLLYLIFFLLQTSIKSNSFKGKIDPVIWVWIVNSFYLLLAIGLNFWDTVLIRRLRAKFIYTGVV